MTKKINRKREIKNFKIRNRSKINKTRIIKLSFNLYI